MKQVFLYPRIIINQNLAEITNFLELYTKQTIDKNFDLTTMVQSLDGTLVMQQKSNRELDQQLIDQVKQGDKTAFKEIYSHFFLKWYTTLHSECSGTRKMLRK